jgi:hypothetical protein
VRITAATWNLVLGILLFSHGYRWWYYGVPAKNYFPLLPASYFT